MEIPETVLGSGRDLSGTRISHYKLLQRIGEGGFGEVYMAEQQEPVSRKVALKVIKPGMDSREVIARFESERQALAMMEHPNIAQVLDAGTTSTGQPYFVMELVRGVPITDFCDRNKYTFDERLRLFVSVCHAVQHAHHKGVIHRDIKPSNVLVTLHDGVPVVKVIDFGVAKATAQKLTERTLFTAWGQMIGTPAYMSPEQAEMSGLDIDTRSDVYSLGVLLYELLTGSTPLDSQRIKEMGFAQLQKMIAEQEPVRPSLRISSMGQAATVLAGNRSTDMKRWMQSLQGDLDWIVMKTLEKDRNRRYATPNSLAADIDRFLKGEAIEARPPSISYRLYRGYRRNRLAVAVTGAFMLVLLAATVLSLAFAIQARTAKETAEQRRKEAELSQQQLQDALGVAEAAKAEAEDLTAQIISSSVTINFDEHNLLLLTSQLPRISASQKRYKDFVKISIYGALQYLATSTDYEISDSEGRYNVGETISPTKASQIRILGMKNDVLAISSIDPDVNLKLIRLSTRETIAEFPDLFGVDMEITDVHFGDDLVMVTGDVFPCAGISTQTGKKLWEVTVDPPVRLSAAPTSSEAATPASGPAVLTFPGDKSVAGETCLLSWHTSSDDNIPSHYTLLNIRTGMTRHFKTPLTGDTKFRLSSNGKRVAAIDSDNKLVIWDSESGEPLFADQFTDRIPVDLCFSPDSELLAIALNPVSDANESEIAFWLQTGQSLIRRREFRAPLSLQWNDLSFPDPSIITCMNSTESEFTESGYTWIMADRLTPASGESPSVEVQTLDSLTVQANADYLLVNSNDTMELLDRNSLTRISGTATARFPEQMRAFAFEQRYIRFEGEDDSYGSGSLLVMDLQTGLEFPGTYWERFEPDPLSKYVLCGNPEYFTLLIPAKLDHVDDSQLLLLAQLMACGEFSDQREFRFWSQAEFDSRLQSAMDQGAFSDPGTLQIREYLTLPTYWVVKRIGRLQSELKRLRPAMFAERQQVLSELESLWQQLYRLDNSAEPHLAYIVFQRSIKSISPEQELSLILQIVRKWPEEYWAKADYSLPGSDDLSPLIWTDVRETSVQKLLAEWYQIRLNQPSDSVPACSNQDWITYAWCLLQTGRGEQAVEILSKALNQEIARLVEASQQAAASETPMSPLAESETPALNTDQILLTGWLLLVRSNLNQPEQANAAKMELYKLLGADPEKPESFTEKWQAFAQTNSSSEFLSVRIMPLLK